MALGAIVAIILAERAAAGYPTSEATRIRGVRRVSGAGRHALQYGSRDSCAMVAATAQPPPSTETLESTTR